MVKILHVSDSHVSHRRTKDVKYSWKRQNKVTWIEDDFCIGFKNSFEQVTKADYDYVIHTGDLFDVPVSRNLSSPSEYSRAYVINVLNDFVKKTKGEVPLIIIDGNHGTYFTRDNSTLEFLEAAFPGIVYIATNYQLKRAIVEKKPLKLEFDDIIFYLFPYFDFGAVASHARAYEEWLDKCQKPDNSKISVAMVHGMDIGKDLHSKILQFSYDYVALGHNHLQMQKKDNAWFCGSSEKYTFFERNHKKGVLDVEVEKGQKPNVNPIPLTSARDMIQHDILLKSDINELEFEKTVEEITDKHKGKFDGNTAVRLKLKFNGNILLTNWWRMEDFLLDIQKEVFSDEYNILEFRWDAMNLVRLAPPSLTKSAKFHEYLIDNPIEDFERYMRNKAIPEEDLAKTFIDEGAEIIKEVFGEIPETSTETSTEQETSITEEVNQ